MRNHIAKNADLSSYMALRKSPRKKTLKEQEKGRRKLDFQEKFRERSSTDKVFKSKSFYLDGVLKSKATLIKKRIENLGGIVEEFYSKDIFMIITSQKLPDTEKGKDFAQSPLSTGPSPVPNIPSPYCSVDYSPQNSIEIGKKSNRIDSSRAKNILKRTLSGNRGSTTNILERAKGLNQRIISVDGFMSKYMRKKSSLTDTKINDDSEKKSLQMLKTNRARTINNVKVYQLIEPFLKVEDQSQSFRPLVYETKEWPQIYYETSRSQCPFDLPRRDFKSDKGKTTQDAAEIDKETQTLELKEVISEKEEKDKPALASTHKREEMRKEAGYCDCCSIKYDDLEKHWKSEQHRNFATDESNFKHLDELIKEGPDVFSFIQQLKCIKIRREKEQKGNVDAESDLQNHATVVTRNMTTGQCTVEKERESNESTRESNKNTKDTIYIKEVNVKIESISVDYTPNPGKNKNKIELDEEKGKSVDMEDLPRSENSVEDFGQEIFRSRVSTPKKTVKDKEILPVSTSININSANLRELEDLPKLQPRLKREISTICVDKKENVDNMSESSQLTKPSPIRRKIAKRRRLKSSQTSSQLRENSARSDYDFEEILKEDKNIVEDDEVSFNKKKLNTFTQPKLETPNSHNKMKLQLRVSSEMIIDSSKKRSATVSRAKTSFNNEEIVGSVSEISVSESSTTAFSNLRKSPRLHNTSDLIKVDSNRRIVHETSGYKNSFHEGEKIITKYSSPIPLLNSEKPRTPLLIETSDIIYPLSGNDKVTEVDVKNYINSNHIESLEVEEDPEHENRCFLGFLDEFNPNMGIYCNGQNCPNNCQLKKKKKSGERKSKLKTDGSAVSENSEKIHLVEVFSNNCQIKRKLGQGEKTNEVSINEGNNMFSEGSDPIGKNEKRILAASLQKVLPDLISSPPCIINSSRKTEKVYNEIVKKSTPTRVVPVKSKETEIKNTENNKENLGEIDILVRSTKRKTRRTPDDEREQKRSRNESNFESQQTREQLIRNLAREYEEDEVFESIEDCEAYFRGMSERIKNSRRSASLKASKSISQTLNNASLAKRSSQAASVDDESSPFKQSEKNGRPPRAAAVIAVNNIKAHQLSSPNSKNSSPIKIATMARNERNASQNSSRSYRTQAKRKSVSFSEEKKADSPRKSPRKKVSPYTKTALKHRSGNENSCFDFSM